MNNNLKAIREAVNKTQEMVASDLGLSLSTYRSWEQGNRRLSGEALIVLSCYFNVTTDSILWTVHSDREYEHAIPKSPQHKRLIRLFESLNDDGKRKVFDYIDDLILARKYKKTEV